MRMDPLGSGCTQVNGKGSGNGIDSDTFVLQERKCNVNKGNLQCL